MRIPAQTRQQSSAWVLQFINIVFLILLFFLVGGTIAETPNQDILPPITLQNETSNPPHNALYIRANGDLVFNDQVLTMSQFLTLHAPTSQQLTIVADRRMPAHILLNTISVLRSLGIPDVVLITVKS